ALERERQQVATLTQQVEGQARARQAGPPLLSLFLLPGTSRTATTRPQLVVPSPAPAQIRLQVRLEPPDQFARFRIELRPRSGESVLARDDLSPVRSDAGRQIVLTMPANLLRTGRYELSLKGVVDARTTEDVRYYYFDITSN